MEAGCQSSRLAQVMMYVAVDSSFFHLTINKEQSLTFLSPNNI